MKKTAILLTFALFIFNVSPSYAFFGNKIDKVIRRANLENKTTIAISVKNAKTGKNVYNKTSKKLLHPASSLKLFSFASSLNTLGENYKFETKMLVNGNDVYIKLGADPLLEPKNLRELVSGAKNKLPRTINKIYIDDSIIDKQPYPKGWLSDDISSMQKLSPYTLNQNMAHVLLTFNHKGEIEVVQDDAYKISIINRVSKGLVDDVEISKDYGENNDILTLDGTISKDYKLDIAVNNPKFYFISNLEEVFKKEKIAYGKLFYSAPVPKNAVLVSSVSHSIKDVGRAILRCSDNFSSDITFKVAGGAYKNKNEATMNDAIEMFENYYKSLGFDTVDIQIVDGSGVSRYNLLSASWMSDVLIYLYKNSNIKDYMAVPDVGTLSRRMRHLKGKLYAKTGTLMGVSSLSGFITTRDKRELVFAIIIQNYKKPSSVIKGFEDDLMDAIYKL